MQRRLARFRQVMSPLLVMLMLVLCADLSEARKVRAGDKYRSLKGLFTILVPGVCSPIALPYEVGQIAKSTGHEAWEEAWFYIHDMGELYRVGVFRLTPELRSLVKTPEGPLPAPALSWLGVRTHLGKREPRTGKWSLVSHFSVETPYGSGELSVNEVEGGHFLEKYTGEGWNKKVPDPPRPAVVVVLVVQRGEDVVFVTGQADAYMAIGRGRTNEVVRADGDAQSGQAPEAACLVTEVRKIADGMSLAPRAVGER